MSAARKLRVFLSSPGDVGMERALARRAMARVQGAFRGTVELEPILWEDEPLAASQGFQTQIVRPADCDIVIAIVWSRLGTPLPRSLLRADGTPYQSGTEFEIEDALAGAQANGRPHILLYRKTAPPPPVVGSDATVEDALVQRRSLRAFLDKILNSDDGPGFKGASHEYTSANQFDALVEQHLTKLVARLVPETAGEAAPALRWTFGSPYRGLASFEPEHASIFFGRTTAISEAIDRLQRQAKEGCPCLFIVGASGLGKSSLAKAGVLPLITQGGVIEGVARWRYAVFRPSDAAGSPLLSLLSALDHRDALPALGRMHRDLDTAATAEQILSALAKYDEGGDPAHLLLVADQLEECFTDPATDEPARAKFADALAALLASGRVWIVGTLRSDFYPALSASPAFRPLKSSAAQLDLGSPTRDEIGQLIRLPTIEAGLKFDVDEKTGQPLDERLREAALENPAALPLLEFTLEELYRQRTADGVLTFAAYRALGELEGSLGRRAEAVFETLDPSAKAELPAILAALVRDDEDDTILGRRRVPLAQFGSEAARKFVAAFVEARLFVSELSASGEPSISVAHEALLTHWQRVGEWVQENRDLLRMRARLESAERRWSTAGRRGEYLLALGRPLSEARAVAAAGLELHPDEQAFLAASIKRAGQIRAVRMGAVAMLIVLGVAAGVAALIAREQAKQATQQARTAQNTSDFLVSLFSKADPLKNRGRELTAHELLDQGAKDIDTNLKSEPLVQASLLQSMGVAFTGLGAYDAALENLKKSYAERTKLLGANSPQTIDAGIDLASAYYSKADYDAAEGLLEGIIAARAAGDPQLMMHAKKMLGLTYLKSGDATRGLATLKEAQALLGKPRNDLWNDRAEILYGIGAAQSRLGNFAEAQAALEASLALRSANLAANDPSSADDPQVWETKGELGWLLQERGDLSGAEKLKRATLAHMERVYGPNHREVATALNDLGRVLLMAARPQEAAEFLARTLAIDTADLKGADSPDLIFPLNSLGQAQMELGLFPDARANLDHARRLAVADESWMLGPILTNLADLENRSGNFAAARDVERQAREALEKDFPPASRTSDSWRFALLDSIEGETEIGLGARSDRAKLMAGLQGLRAKYPPGSLYVTAAEKRLARAKSAP